MDQRLTMITLGVRDLARARKFYEALGWTAREAGGGDIVFFQLQGSVMGLYPRPALAEDAALHDDAPNAQFGGIALAYNARNKAEVDRVLVEAKTAGAKILKPGARRLLGRLFGLLCRYRRPSVGGCVQPALAA